MLKSPLLQPAALPRGFRLQGVAAGISSRPGKKDLALFFSERPAAAAGVFTRNIVRAAPVLVSQKHLRSSLTARVIVVNSGCANACTGDRGLHDAQWSAAAVAKQLQVPEREVLVASTGVIGHFLPRPALSKGIARVAERLMQEDPESVSNAVEAILTTDTRPKAASAHFDWQGRRFTLWGCAKGAGMIHPNMATMLAFLLTDMGLPGPALRADLSWAVERTFNRISIDGDTSTNDSVFFLANGAAGAFARPPRDLREVFRNALYELCRSLSEQIVADGEGATRTACVMVEGARTEKDAARLAATVATSPLVKTALHGADPNWGRVMAALGRAGVRFNPGKVEVRFGDVLVCRNGKRATYAEKDVHAALKGSEVRLTVNLHAGRARSHYLTCDYSKEYISINADYTT